MTGNNLNMTGNKFCDNLIDKSAFSLLETMIAVAIFAVIVLASSQIFLSVLNVQSTNISDQDMQENIKYFLEIFTREAQSAQRSSALSAPCLAGGTQYYATQIFATSSVFSASSTELYFKNSSGQCVEYHLDTDSAGINRIKIRRDSADDYITSPNVNIKSLSFAVDDVGTSTQPLVTVNVQVQSADDPNLAAYNIQTSISPRSWQ
jgi:prepilin-type N-terminal cleavage/methylation domain-containing protein